MSRLIWFLAGAAVATVFWVFILDAAALKFLTDIF